MFVVVHVMRGRSVLAELLTNKHKIQAPHRGSFFISKRGNYMKRINKFYLKQAVYQLEISGSEIALLLDYAGNRYEVIGEKHERVDEIALALLKKKHGVNFADKFNGKLKQENL
jgi:hypothetical protein